MTERPGSEKPSPETVTEPGGGRRWLLPAALFVVGLLLGGVAVAVADVSDDGSPTATPSTSPSPSPAASPSSDPRDVNILIPAPCVQVAEEADAAFEEVDELAAAVRDFDARTLQEFLDRFQDLRPRIESLADQCQQRAGNGLIQGDLVTPTPTPTSS